MLARQRSYLRSLGHPMSPVVRIGRGRLTPQVIEETRRSLDAHELIKVKLDLDEGDERRSIAASLAAETGAEIVGMVGKVALIYRPRPDDPTIKLPS
jgi:RNA-binding protein